MTSFDELVTSLQKFVLSEEQTKDNTGLRLFSEKLTEYSRNTAKRSKEKCLEEAVQLLKRVSDEQLVGLEESLLLMLVRLLISLQLQTVSISTACGKVDEMLQQLAKVNHLMVYREIKDCLHSVIHKDQLSLEDLQRACMFLEDSVVGREVWQESCLSLMQKVAELFSVVLQAKSLTDGPLCYNAVKLCLQIFQLLPDQVSPVVWTEVEGSQVAQKILQALIDIILGQCCNRDTRLLAATAVAMLLNTSESQAAGHAAWGLLQVSSKDPLLLTVGGLQVNCRATREDGVAVLAVSRGLLTCCRPHVLLSSNTDATETCLLLNGLFPLICSLCELKLDCHSFAFEVLTLWLRKVKYYMADIWKMTGVRLLSESTSLQQQIIHIIWTNADSPVEGVSESARNAFCLLLGLYHINCELSGDTEKTLYSTLLQKTTGLPWENKAKYYQLCALLPYLGTDMVLDNYPELPNHLLKCLSTNHLSSCGSELYKCLLQQQRQELHNFHNELYLANEWARCWKSVLFEALTSDVTLLQNNSSTHLLPCTFQVFPSAVEPLLATLNPSSPSHLYAWACIMSSYRATTGHCPWTLQGSAIPKTLHLALESADDKVRLAAFSLFCCSPKTNVCPTPEELELMKGFIPQNLNCESSSFRQHFQTGIRRFLVRIRDSCLSFVKVQSGKKKHNTANKQQLNDLVDQGIGFVEWLGQLPYYNLAQGHSYQRKKTALLLLSAVLETCTDTWSPDKKKGQPPVNMGCLINYVKQRGQWDFFCLSKQLVLISCLEDSTNEIRELSANLLLRFFPPSFPNNVSAALLTRTKQLLCSPRVHEAQMAALMIKVLQQKSHTCLEDNIALSCGCKPKGFSFVRFLVREMEEHYRTAKSDMMLAARTKPIHGILSALQRCLFELPINICDKLDSRLTTDILDLLENISRLLLGVLYGDQNNIGIEQDAPPSFCDMGKAITSLIAQSSGGSHNDQEECVLLSEEHSLVLTCCWVSLKETGIFLGSLVEHVLSHTQATGYLLTKPDLIRASKVFWNILLKCRHWGAVEGCCIGFTKFCASLLRSNDQELKEIPADMLKQGLQVIKSPRSTSVTRRAAGLPMLILCVVSAEESSKARPLLAQSMQILLATAKAPLPESWDQTLDLPQVCAVHTLQALFRGTAVGSAVLHFAPAVAILSLTLLSSPSWAMRNAALQLYSSLCSRMLGHCSSNEEDGSARKGMSSTAFFFNYSELQPFLLAELKEAARVLQGRANEAKLHLRPSLYPILTLLAQLHPGAQDPTQSLSDFLSPLVQLSASPIYSVRVMASRGLVAMTPHSENVKILLTLMAQVPSAQQPYCHNWLHGHLLQMKALLDRALCTQSPATDLCMVLSKVEASLWLATEAQCCPLVRMAYVGLVETLTRFCSEMFLSKLNDILAEELQKPQRGLQIGLSSFHQRSVQFLCKDLQRACQIWRQFPALSPDVKLMLVKWVLDGCSSQQTKELIQRVLQANLREALLSDCVEYRQMYLSALVTMTDTGELLVPQHPPKSALEEPVLLECLELLLVDLENQRGGPELLSRALCVVSLLLHHCCRISTIERWCKVLECLCSPHSPEVLRVACAEALHLAGVSLISNSLRKQHSPPAMMIRLINTGLHLLQDQSVQVRMKAASFASMLHHSIGGAAGSIYIMQVNKALPFLLDQLLEHCWYTPDTLDVLLSHLPQPGLRSLQKEALENGCVSLYEQDKANVFSEPSVMSAQVLPYLLEMADKCAQSCALAKRLSVWAEESCSQVLDDLTVCTELQSGKLLTWLTLLIDPHFHSTLCGLLTRAALLMRLIKSCDDVRHVCDLSTLHQTVQDVCALLSENGVHFPSAFSAAVAGELSK